MASEPRRRPPPERRRPQRRRRRRGRSDFGARVLAALPAIAFVAAITAKGGLVFVGGLFVVGMVCMAEFFKLMAQGRPVPLAGYLGLIGLLLAAYYGDQFQILLVFVATVPLTFFLMLARQRRENVAWGIAATLLGITWIGLALAHAVLLRDLNHGGALVVDVLIATFVGDTCAYLAGRAWGQRPLAPRISPNKTVEGLLVGILGGTLAFWAVQAGWQNSFLGSTHALIMGLAISVAAPVGDLFESMIKRDVDVKDTGTVFGPHGGALDRLDAVFFTAVVGYYVALAFL